jgi:hypothetical protein
VKRIFLATSGCFLASAGEKFLGHYTPRSEVGKAFQSTIASFGCCMLRFFGFRQSDLLLRELQVGGEVLFYFPKPKLVEISFGFHQHSPLVVMLDHSGAFENQGSVTFFTSSRISRTFFLIFWRSSSGWRNAGGVESGPATFSSRRRHLRIWGASDRPLTRSFCGIPRSKPGLSH